MGPTTRLAVWSAALLMITSLTRTSANTQGLELTAARDLLTPGTHDTCGQLSCKANGNSHTIESISVSRVEVAGETSVLFTLNASQTKIDFTSGDMRGHGAFGNNQAGIHLDLLTPAACGSSSFTCAVQFTNQSGERQRAFASAGPGEFPTDQPDQPLQEPDNPQAPELQRLKDQLSKVEAKCESVSDRLDRKMSLVFDTIQTLDTSSRVARLEDRLSSLVLPQAPGTNQHVQQALEDLTASLKEMNVSVTALEDHQLQKEKPAVCSRGMGNDVTRRYPPYAIMTMDSLKRQVLCDTKTNGGGWILIQRRTKGDVDFYRDWTSYRDGFGSPTGDFWLGNEAIHQLTNSAAYELRVDIRFKGQEQFAEYAHFRIEDEADKYRLRLGQYSGTAGDGLTYSNDQPFSTFEEDNDGHKSSCAVDFHGAWWYKTCARANLNGEWGVPANRGNFWIWVAGKEPVSFSEMKIRRVG